MKFLELLSGSLILGGIGIMAIGIFGSIYATFNNIETNISLLAVAGLGILFAGCMLSLGVSKDDVKVEVDE